MPADGVVISGASTVDESMVRRWGEKCNNLPLSNNARVHVCVKRFPCMCIMQVPTIVPL